VVGIGLGQLQNFARREHQSDPVSLAIQSAVTPAAYSVGSAVSWTGDFFVGMRDAAGLKRENEALRSQVAAMEMYSVDLDEMRRQNDQMGEELGLAPFPGRTSIFGKIVDYSPYENRITLNKGSEDGIKALLPVVSPQGLVGRVEVVDPHSCQVLLITAPSLEIGAKVQRDIPVAGLLHGNSPNLLTLEVVDHSVVKVGDLVVTSGYSALIPGGILIGEVAEVPLPDDYNNRRIKVFPKFRLALSQEVAVIK
jgi:rod shape-determining protein MreC